MYSLTNSCNGFRIFVTFYAKSRIKTAKNTTPLSKALCNRRHMAMNEKFQELSKLGAGDFDHIDGNLIDHLRGTQKLLKEWSASAILKRFRSLGQ